MRVSQGANLAIAGAIVGLFVTGMALHPVSEPGGTSLELLGLRLPTLCWFRLTTGLACAGCGLTRSIVLLLHGDPAASFALHPFGMVMAGLGLLQLPPRLGRAAGGPGAWIARWDRAWVLALILTYVSMLAWWAVRLDLGLLLRRIL